MISDEAVEAAAKALWQHGEMPDLEWDQLDRISKIVSLDEARAALEAAAPHLMAQAWDEGMEWRAAGEYIPECEYTPNPYRSQA